ncbi:MAG: hypothetical protein GY772_24150 [bacterium]|nr:hypothetical protein [bacterium]
MHDDPAVPRSPPGEFLRVLSWNCGRAAALGQEQRQRLLEADVARLPNTWHIKVVAHLVVAVRRALVEGEPGNRRVLLFPDVPGRTRWWRFVQEVTVQVRGGASEPPTTVVIVNVHNVSSSRTGQIRGQDFRCTLDQTTKNAIVTALSDTYGRLPSGGASQPVTVIAGDFNYKKGEQRTAVNRFSEMAARAPTVGCQWVVLTTQVCACTSAGVVAGIE